MNGFLCTSTTSLAPVLDLLASLAASAWGLAGTLALVLLVGAAASYGVVLGVLIATRRHGPIRIDLTEAWQGRRE